MISQEHGDDGIDGSDRTRAIHIPIAWLTRITGSKSINRKGGIWGGSGLTARALTLDQAIGIHIPVPPPEGPGDVQLICRQLVIPIVSRQLVFPKLHG